MKNLTWNIFQAIPPVTSYPFLSLSLDAGWPGPIKSLSKAITFFAIKQSLSFATKKREKRIGLRPYQTHLKEVNRKFANVAPFQFEAEII
jgi:hypothetical protein